MVKQIQYLMNPCNCCNFWNKNLYYCFCFWVLQVCFIPLTPVQAVTSLGLPLLTSSLWTKIGIIYTQLLQMEKIFPIIPRSECSALRRLRYAPKVEWKIQRKIFCRYTWLLHSKICSSPIPFLWSFLTASKPIRRTVTAAKRKEKGKKEKRKEI